MAGCLNRCSTRVTPGRISPYEAFTGIKPNAIVLPCFRPGIMSVLRKTKLDDPSATCYFLRHGYQHGRSTVRVLKASIGQVCHTRDVLWISRCAFLSPTPTLAAAPPQPPPTVQPRFQPRPRHHQLSSSVPAASAGERGGFRLPATQQPLPIPSTPSNPATPPLLPPLKASAVWDGAAACTTAAHVTTARASATDSAVALGRRAVRGWATTGGNTATASCVGDAAVFP